MSKWWNDINPQAFKVDHIRFNTYDKAAEYAEKKAIEIAVKTPGEKCYVEITAYFKDDNDTEPKWYHLEDVVAELTVFVGDDPYK